MAMDGGGQSSDYRRRFTVAAAVTTLLVLPNLLGCSHCYCSASDVYTDSWAVQVEGGEAAAKRVAERNGFIYVGPIMLNYYQFRHSKMRKRSTDSGEEYSSGLAHELSVRWFEQQVAKRRVKRDIHFNDPKWPQMWYMRSVHGASTLLDMNVRKAWAKGYTGRGIVVTILDDGIEKSHPDLEKNYDSEASYDVNDRDYDPSPRYDNTNENRHGTRCAGEVAAVANNGICSVGVAYEASVGGIRMLDGDVTDSVEANALSYNSQHIDIYSISWGPEDDGKTVDGPGSLARKAFREGAAKGRKGKGSIFVWASGNGGRDNDNCNCDGYTNSIYTLSISSVSENGYVPWYSEACSSTLATTFSSGGPGERQVMTTDLRRNCTESHTGTSASAPLAAGICALTLQANPSLTWRDMQHIVVMTANPAGLHSLGEWRTNGVGRNVSHNFGYGMMDAAAMVALAENWTSVPEQHTCEVESARTNEMIPAMGKIIIPLTVDGCASDPDRHVKYLEHVQAKISLSSSRRGDVSIYLRSPMGTVSTLLAQRPSDNSKQGFTNWAFMTTHTWGEKARGTWYLEVHNGYRAMRPARLLSWSLILYGTDRSPLSGEPERGQLTHRSVSKSAVGHTKGSTITKVDVDSSPLSSPKQPQRQPPSPSRTTTTGLDDDDAQMIARSGKLSSHIAGEHRGSAEAVLFQTVASSDEGPLSDGGGGGSEENRPRSSVGCSEGVGGAAAVRWFVHGDHRHKLPCWPDAEGDASGDGDQEEGDDEPAEAWSDDQISGSSLTAGDGNAAASSVADDGADDQSVDPASQGLSSTPRSAQNTVKRQHPEAMALPADGWTLTLRGAGPDELRAVPHGRGVAMAVSSSGRVSGGGGIMSRNGAPRTSIGVTRFSGALAVGAVLLATAAAVAQ